MYLCVVCKRLNCSSPWVCLLSFYFDQITARKEFTKNTSGTHKLELNLFYT
jgi:hypothetical protein